MLVFTVPPRARGYAMMTVSKCGHCLFRRTTSRRDAAASLTQFSIDQLVVRFQRLFRLQILHVDFVKDGTRHVVSVCFRQRC